MERVAHWSWTCGNMIWNAAWHKRRPFPCLSFTVWWCLIARSRSMRVRYWKRQRQLLYFAWSPPTSGQPAFYLNFYLKKHFVILIYFNQQSISLTFIILTCILTFHLTFYPAFYLILYSAFDLILYSAFDPICYLLYIYIYTCYLINALPCFSAFWVRSGNVFRGSLDGLVADIFFWTVQANDILYDILPGMTWGSATSVGKHASFR